MGRAGGRVTDFSFFPGLCILEGSSGYVSLFPLPPSATLRPARILDSPVLLADLFARRRSGTLPVACDVTLGDTPECQERALPRHVVESGIIPPRQRPEMSTCKNDAPRLPMPN
jgi:hypothetical protein